MNNIEDYKMDVEKLINKRRNSIKEFIAVLNNTAQKVFGTKKKNRKYANINVNYIINRKTKKFHLKDSGCNSFKNVDSRYINETTATERDLIKAGLDACEKCMKDE